MGIVSLEELKKMREECRRVRDRLVKLEQKALILFFKQGYSESKFLYIALKDVEEHLSNSASQCEKALILLDDAIGHRKYMARYEKKTKGRKKK